MSNSLCVGSMLLLCVESLWTWDDFLPNTALKSAFFLIPSLLLEIEENVELEKIQKLMFYRF